MVMSFGGVSKAKVATVIVAADGSGDTTDIQAGINLLPATGGVVYIKEGTFAITASIEINKSDVGLIGAGKSTKISTTSNIPMIHSDGKTGLLINSIYLYGAGGANNANHGIFLEAAGSDSIEKCWIERCGVYGIIVDGDNDTIRDCRVDDCVWGGIVVYGAISMVTINTVDNCGQVGIYVNANECIISNNNTMNNNGNGIGLLGSDNCLIIGNKSTANNNGIFIAGGCDANLILGNNLLGNTTPYVDGGIGNIIEHNL